MVRKALVIQSILVGAPVAGSYGGVKVSGLGPEPSNSLNSNTKNSNTKILKQRPAEEALRQVV